MDNNIEKIIKNQLVIEIKNTMKKLKILKKNTMN